jgi:hypothetical protein
MMIDTWTTVQKLMEDTGLSAEDILRMPADEYARATGRRTPSQVAVAALGYDEPVPGIPRQEQAPQPPAPVQEPQGTDIASMTMAEYEAVRGQLGVQGREYGTGIMNSNSGTDAWVQAARSKSGRAAMNESGVQQAAQANSSKYLTRNEPVQGRASFYRGA